MNDQFNSVNTSTTACPVPQACGSRLPCGVCLITNQRCPLMPCAPSITWTSSDVPYSHQFDPTCTSQSTGQHTNIKATMNIEKE